MDASFITAPTENKSHYLKGNEKKSKADQTVEEIYIILILHVPSTV